MISMYRFEPNIKFLDNIETDNTTDTIKNEPMLYSADLMFARKYGGTITKKVLDRLESFLHTDHGKDVLFHNRHRHLVIDTKSVMLMPNQSPCIPGWHCDGAPRAEFNSQPDLNEIDKNQQNFIFMVSDTGNISNTQLLRTPCDFYYDENEVWGTINKNVSACISKGIFDDFEHGKHIVQANDGEFIMFNQATLHTGTVANKRGFRYFFRASFLDNAAKNEIRNQVQVYADVNKGW